MSEYSRREFVKFLGGSGLAFSVAGCDLSFLGLGSKGTFAPWEVRPTHSDQVVLAEGLNSDILIKWGDPLNQKGEVFGFNNDYIAFLPLPQKNRALLWVNHEYPNPLFISQSRERTKENVDRERQAVGGSLFEIVKDESGLWSVDLESSTNRRFDGTTLFPFAANRKVRGKGEAEGTMANCAGGVTPWGSVLTCEENFQDYYGDREHGHDSIERGFYSWHQFYDNPPEHYGWVVEIDPKTGKGKKLTSLGRFAHESATVVKSPKTQKLVVYSGDDKANEFLYKFISHNNESLDEGELFVADTKKGEWLSLSYEKQPLLQEHFENQLDILTYPRKAGRLLGATPLDRPEDIAVHPTTGEVYVALTNNKGAGNFHGQILKVSEKQGDHASSAFQSENFLVGGHDEGFSCPDNLGFDSNGNLWFTSDISGSAIGKGPYEGLGNNGLFYVPTEGPQAGRVFQLASGPVDCEMTGLYFSQDEKTLFISVQHPGENSDSLEKLTSHWPEGGDSIPKPAVIQMRGPRLQKLIRRELG